MSENMPYVSSYGKIKDLFKEIQKASVPQKFTHDYLKTVLGFKSSSHRAFPSLLKRLKFLDQANVPTESYKNFRDSKRSGNIMANSLKDAYSDLFAANEYAYKLKKEELTELFKRVSGLAEDNVVLSMLVGTFIALRDLSNFETKEKEPTEPKSSSKHIPGKKIIDVSKPSTKLGISYTINLNLPPTTDIEVFNSIFKSLKEHILNEE